MMFRNLMMGLAFGARLIRSQPQSDPQAELLAKQPELRHAKRLRFSQAGKQVVKMNSPNKARASSL